MPFKKGEGGRKKGSRNKTTVAIAQRIAATRKPPLEMMLDIADYYYREWLETTDRATRRHAAELTLQASRLAAPYVHAKITPVLEGEDDGKVTVEIMHSQRRLPAPVHVNGGGTNGGGTNGGGTNGSHSPNILN
jgi:hypothetical protein